MSLSPATLVFPMGNQQEIAMDARIKGRRWRTRYRLSTVFWVMLAVACFLAGGGNEWIARRLNRLRPTQVQGNGVSSALPSVVMLSGRRVTSSSGSQRSVNTLGSGVVWDKRGYIVTHYPVIKGVDRIEVFMSDDEKLIGRLVAVDPGSNLAIIKIDSNKPIPVMRVAGSKNLVRGETVTAVGSPYGYHHTVRKGVISALDRPVSIDKDLQYVGLIQTDINSNPGDSGGPLLNRDGRLIGIVVGLRQNSRSIGFAIPGDQVTTVASELIGRIRN